MMTGARIKIRRKELGMSAESLAAECGLSPATIYRYEKGDIENMGIDKLKPIAAALKTTPAYLMGWDDDPIDYDDGDILAQIPLSYVEACDGDMKKAYAMLVAAGKDAAKEYGVRDYAQNSHEEEMLLLARHMDPIPEEDRQALKEQFKNSIDLYLKAKGLSTPEDK